MEKTVAPTKQKHVLSFSMQLIKTSWPAPRIVINLPFHIQMSFSLSESSFFKKSFKTETFSGPIIVLI